jgi:hypothetical protein
MDSGNLMQPEVKGTNPNSPEAVASTSADGRLKIVQVEWQGGRLLITVEGPTVESVTSMEARQLAYQQRFKHGLANAGLDAFGGPYPYDAANKKDLEDHAAMVDASQRPGDLVYRCIHRLTPGL